MAAKNRADLITKLHKYVKKEYEAVLPPSNRSVLDHMLYACCLEDSTTEAADEAFAKLQENFFDWNEVRVTTAEELSESTKSVARPLEAAQRVRKTLQGVFETYYQFDLDFLKKENLGKSVQTFEKFRGVTPFVISYVAQNGLGGHSIPVDKSFMLLCYVLGIVSEAEATKGRIPGLERTIPKAKGIEFAAHVHPFAVEFYSAPFSTKVREKILKLAPDAAERFPKRVNKKKLAAEKAAAEKKAADEKKAAEKALADAEKEAAAAAKKKASKKAAPAKKAAAKPAKKTPAKKTAAKKAAPKKATAKKAAPKKATKKKPPAKKAAAKKAPAKKSTKKATAKKPAKRKK